MRPAQRRYYKIAEQPPAAGSFSGMNGGKRPWRRLAQPACFVAAIALLWPLPFWKSAPKLVVQVSPLVALCSGIALRSFGVGTGIGLISALIAVWRHRWFCRYACPVGLLVECASHLGLKKTSWWSQRHFQLGSALALSTVAGAIAGYPIFLWMDPLAIFSGFLAVRVAGNAMAGISVALLLCIIILLSVTSGALWCARLCPLGAVQDLLGKLRKKSGSMSERLLPDSSILGRMRSARRAFLFGGAGIGLGLLAEKIGAARGENAPLRPPGAKDEKIFAGLCLRCGNCARVCPSSVIFPDLGQAGVAGLLAPIIRYEKHYCLENCNVCTQACPSGALQALNPEKKRAYRIGEALVDGSLCLVALGQKDCDACARACPFDAVSIHWDEERYAAWPEINISKCNGCGACEVACPSKDIKAIRVWKIAD
jgi:ferredoxin-type protein NapF